MDGPREELLSGAGGAGDEHVCLAPGGLSQEVGAGVDLGLFPTMPSSLRATECGRDIFS